MTTTMEFEYLAGDPLNPGFGGTFKVTANGKIIQADYLTANQAAFVLGRVLLAVNEAKDEYPKEGR
jgi:hypothetical protein